MCPVFPELVYTIRGGLPTYPEVLRAISIPELIRFEQAASWKGYLPFLPVFGVFTETYGHTVSQFEESFYQFDINVAA
jgi:hypothetical protein